MLNLFGLNVFQPVVVAWNIEENGRGIVDLATAPRPGRAISGNHWRTKDAIQCGGDGTGRVEPLDRVGQLPFPFYAFVGGAIGDFVADAPHDH